MGHAPHRAQDDSAHARVKITLVALDEGGKEQEVRHAGAHHAEHRVPEVPMKRPGSRKRSEGPARRGAAAGARRRPRGAGPALPRRTATTPSSSCGSPPTRATRMRAHYLAKSGVGLSRLLLRFQKQLDQVQIPNIAGMLGSLMGGAGGAGGLAGLLGGGGPPGAPGSTPQPQTMSIQLWRMAKNDSHKLAQMVPEEDEKKKPALTKTTGLGPKSTPKLDFDTENPELAKKMGARKFGGFDGCFDTVISDEKKKSAST